MMRNDCEKAANWCEMLRLVDLYIFHIIFLKQFFFFPHGRVCSIPKNNATCIPFGDTSMEIEKMVRLVSYLGMPQVLTT